MQILPPISTVLRHGVDLDYRVSPPSPPQPAKDLFVTRIIDSIVNQIMGSIFKIKVVYKPLLLHDPLEAFSEFGYEVLAEVLSFLML